MLYLRDAAEELGLRRLIDRALEFDQVQGIVLTVEPFWLRLMQASKDPQLERIIYQYIQRGYPLDFLHPLAIEGWDAESWTLDPDFFNRRPRYWQRIAKYLGMDSSSPPIVAKVCCVPGQIPEGLERTENRMRVIAESRPIARLSTQHMTSGSSFATGVSIGDQTRSIGTLGGVLSGSDGNRYGVTCEHVAKARNKVYQPSLPDGGQEPYIGKVVFAEDSPVSPKKKCNPYTAQAIKQRFHAQDVSLINLEETGAANNSGGINAVASASSLYPGLLTDFVGRTSGHRTLEVAGLAATYRFQDSDGKNHCLHDLFEIRWPRLAKTIFNRPVAGGDSGAWVTAQGGTGTEWCGMIVGEDRIQGYASFAEHIMNTLAHAGYKLSL